MKKKDLFVFAGFILFLSPFFIFPDVFRGYEDLNKHHGMLMSFVKFALLATFGETLGSRIRTGMYMPNGFGLIPRAIIWGLLGFTIKLSFDVFTGGTLNFLTKMGWNDAVDIFKTPGFTTGKLLIAFCISTFMNTIYAPVMMTIHKITDMHIAQHHGGISALYTPIKVGENMANMNWKVQWGFVFKRTIPLFWIPAHTITFMLPDEYRVLFAAALGIALGVIMAIASIKGNQK
jgi:hypothetical protein